MMWRYHRSEGGLLYDGNTPLCGGCGGAIVAVSPWACSRREGASWGAGKRYCVAGRLVIPCEDLLSALESMLGSLRLVGPAGPGGVSVGDLVSPGLGFQRLPSSYYVKDIQEKPFICPSVHPPIHPSPIYHSSSIHPPTYTSVCPSIHPSNHCLLDHR